MPCMCQIEFYYCVRRGLETFLRGGVRLQRHIFRHQIQGYSMWTYFGTSTFIYFSSPSPWLRSQVTLKHYGDLPIVFTDLNFIYYLLVAVFIHVPRFWKYKKNLSITMAHFASITLHQDQWSSVQMFDLVCCGYGLLIGVERSEPVSGPGNKFIPIIPVKILTAHDLKNLKKQKPSCDV